MTAEVAIINRSAVALASDSAITLQVREAKKIYTSADKIFELSIHDPIGIMIYNSVDFVDIPIDVAIKQFRDSAEARRFCTVEEASQKFFDYLLKDLPPSEESQQKHAGNIISPQFKKIREYFDRTATREWALSQTGKGKKRKAPDMHGIFVNILDRRIKRWEQLPVSEALKDITAEQIQMRYIQTINGEINQHFEELPLGDDDKAMLRTLAALFLHKEELSELSTGMVFAGFGGDEIFPSLHSFEIDGIVHDRIKCKKGSAIRMTRTELGAEILPFAQHEMADRFLDGVDPEFEAGIVAFMREVINATGTELINQMPRSSKKVKEGFRNKLKDSIKVALEKLRNQGIPEVKKQFRQQIEDMVLFMPKQELAALAEAMVNLTSVKRKYSNEEETVGGPIDVAVISRNDGFVWVNRKHYFRSDLNPRYFHRKFGSHGGSNDTR